MKNKIKNHLVPILTPLLICLIAILLVRPLVVSGEEYPGQGKDQLVDALDALTADCDGMPNVVPGVEFDLRQYEDHIRTHVHDYPLNLEEIPPLHEDDRKDLIWRFIAVIFLAHAGVVDIWQEGQGVMVTKHETDREGQDVSGEPEGPDGVERSLGRAQVC